MIVYEVMDYKKIGETYYVRMDRGDEIISNLLEICRKESIPSAIFSGIGGCSSAELQVFVELLLSIQMKKCSFCSFFTQIEHYIKYFYYLCGE